MKFRFAFLFLLATPALATTPPVPVMQNDTLGITARVGSVDDIKGLIVTDIEPGKPGDITGLSVGDVLIGFRSSDVLDPEANPFRAATAKTFIGFPPGFGHMNLRYQVLAHRPSLDQTAILTLGFGGNKAPWPVGTLGITATERPNEPVRLQNRTVETEPDLVVLATYPYMLAARLGIQAGDVIAHGQITLDSGDTLNIAINGAGDLDRCLKTARGAKSAVALVLKVLRPVPEGAAPDAGDLEFTIPITKLR